MCYIDKTIMETSLAVAEARAEKTSRGKMFYYQKQSIISPPLFSHRTSKTITSSIHHAA